MKETPLSTPEEKEKKTIKRNESFFRMKKDEDEDDEDYNQDISNHQSFDENESEESLDIGKGDELQELFENNVIIENNGSIDSDSVVSKSFDDFDYNELSEDEVDELSRGINDLSLKKGEKTEENYNSQENPGLGKIWSEIPAMKPNILGYKEDNYKPDLKRKRSQYERESINTRTSLLIRQFTLYNFYLPLKK